MSSEDEKVPPSQSAAGPALGGLLGDFFKYILLVIM
jgi:hypothetical protein